MGAGMPLLLALALLSSPPGAAGDLELSGGAAVFFDRGHYWIELGLKGGGPSDGGTDREDFTITDVESGESFTPSRAEIVRTGGDGACVVLSSGKIKGKRCYNVTYRPAGPSARIGPVCDPAGRAPAPPEGGPAGFFRDHVAPAFASHGEEYRWNRLSAGYDLASSKGAAEVLLEPVFRAKWLELTPFFTYKATTYVTYDPERSASRMRAGADAAARRWFGVLRAEIEGGYAYCLESATEAEDRDARSARIDGLVRFDNLFDPLNRHAVSVFKGMDAGAGYAWYDSAGADGDLSREGVLLMARATWTFAASVQLSYGVEACRLSGGGWQYWHSARVRLLLRGALEHPPERSFHPDLELTADWGRRLPFFDREERILLGFTFDLYPW